MARVNPRPGNVCLSLHGSSTIVPLEDGGTPHHHKFNFDHVFPQESKQDQVFEKVGIPTIAKILEGYNGTVFAYGQTGSGKTHTMLAPEGGSAKCLNPKNEQNFAQRGLIPRMAQALFDKLAKLSEEQKHTQTVVTCSFYEIYNEELLDLLSEGTAPPSPTPSPGEKKQQQGKRVRMEGTKETFKIIGLVSKNLSGPEDLLDLIQKGTAKRHVASTNMNSTSSRSHSIIQINVIQNDTVLKNVTTSQLNLVDLAGCESLGRTGAKGQTALEGTKINLSLTTLGIVINQLCKGEKFISFRDSMLTRVLQNSLGGNTLTTLIVTMSQLRENYSDTMSVLRFAERAKQIKNKARVNKQRSAAEWELLYKGAEEEIENLKQRLALSAGVKSPGPGHAPGGGFDSDAADLRNKMNRCLEDLEEQRAVLREKENELFNAKQRLQSLTAELDEVRDELSMVELDKNESQAMYESTLENVKKLEDEVKRETRSKDDLQKQIKKLQVDVAGAREESKLLRESEQRRDVEDLEHSKALATRDAEIAALKREVASKTEEVQRGKEDMDYQATTFKETEQSLKDTIARLKAVGTGGVDSALKGALDQQDETIRLIKEENQALREERNGLKQKLQVALATVDTDTDQFKTQIVQLEAIVEHQKKTNAELCTTVKRGAEDREALRQETLVLNEKLASETAHLENQVRMLETEKAAMRGELDHIKDVHGNCRKEIEERDCEIERLRDRIRELEHDNSLLEAEAEKTRQEVYQLGKETTAYSNELKDRDTNIQYVQDTLKEVAELILGHKSLTPGEQEEIMEKLRRAMETRNKDMLDKLAARLYDEHAQHELVLHVEAVMEDRVLDVEDMKERLHNIVNSGDVIPDSLEKNIGIVKRQLTKVVEIMSLRTFHSPADEALRHDLLSQAQSLSKTVIEIESEVKEFKEMNETATKVICPFCSDLFDKQEIKEHVRKSHS
eukprot:TRINITY_DN14907_c0_g1_i1.p1 TRINITY_DN14907_c0_g1~~TRINITY_DN14907_c0_g1_i1.p1  ORF type:complete len:1063 (+),score=462.16 TRINITY_DN14907_c0_g1_i1:308-3190(+)